jgi:hypothetical protein
MLRTEDGLLYWSSATASYLFCRRVAPSARNIAKEAGAATPLPVDSAPVPVSRPRRGEIVAR